MQIEQRFGLSGAVKFGLFGGIAAMLVSLIGMVDAFEKNDIITGILTMSQVMLMAFAFGAAYAAASQAQRTNRGIVIPGAMVAGAVTGLMIGLLALAIVPLNMRAVFVNATPQLAAELMPGETSGLIGALLLVVLGAAVGLVAALISYIPTALRNAILFGIIATVLIALLKDVFVPVLPRSTARFIYSSNGLTVIGAVLVFVTSTVLMLVWTEVRPRITSRLNTMPPKRLQVLRLVFTMLALIVLFILPRFLGAYLSEVADLVGFYIVMALGLNVVVGFAGLLDLGYVAFFAIGAYTMAVLTTPELPLVRSVVPQMSFWMALPIAVLVALIAGVLLGVPVLKTRGDYLAIITLGFGEIIRLLVLSDALKPVLGGAQGITGVARPELGSLKLDSPQEMYYLILISILIAWFVTSRLKKSRLGRAWMAVREDEDVAAAMSINLVRYKLAAFATGATLAGLSGALFGSKLGSMVPASFNVLVSINVLAVLIVGGMGSLPGVIVGALALIGLPELLREFNEFRWWVYGVVLIVMMLYKPEGLWPEATLVRELHEADAAPVVEDESDTPQPA